MGIVEKIVHGIIHFLVWIVAIYLVASLLMGMGRIIRNVWREF